eukprot:scaffold2610_cov212-Pinguiococcus_pyrenoidosus.AAC.1
MGEAIMQGDLNRIDGAALRRFAATSKFGVRHAQTAVGPLFSVESDIPLVQHLLRPAWDKWHSSGEATIDHRIKRSWGSII